MLLNLKPAAVIRKLSSLCFKAGINPIPHITRYKCEEVSCRLRYWLLKWAVKQDSSYFQVTATQRKA